MSNEVKRTCEAERKHRQRKARASASPSAKSTSERSCIICNSCSPVSILYNSIAGRYRPARVADGPITARYRVIKNAS